MARKLMVTVYYDDDAGELAGVKVNPAFRREPGLRRADVLKDLIHVVFSLYDEAVLHAVDWPDLPGRKGEAEADEGPRDG